MINAIFPSTFPPLSFFSVLGRSRREGLQYSTLRRSLSVVPQPLLSHQISRSLSEQHMVNALKIVCWSFSLLYSFFSSAIASLAVFFSCVACSSSLYLLLDTFLSIQCLLFFIYCISFFSSSNTCSLSLLLKLDTLFFSGFSFSGLSFSSFTCPFSLLPLPVSLPHLLPFSSLIVCHFSLFACYSSCPPPPLSTTLYHQLISRS